MAKKSRSESWKNVEAHRKGKAKLKNVVLQHPDETKATSIYDFVKRNISKTLSVVSYDKYKAKK